MNEKMNWINFFVQFTKNNLIGGIKTCETNNNVMRLRIIQK